MIFALQWYGLYNYIAEGFALQCLIAPVVHVPSINYTTATPVLTSY